MTLSVKIFKNHSSSKNRTKSVPFTPVDPESSSLSFHSRSTINLPYEDALNLYRTNAKKSNDPEKRFEFAKYLLDASIAISNSDDESKQESKSGLLEEGFKWLRKLAYQSTGLGRAPYADAQYYLADCYMTGKYSLDTDNEKAFHLYLQASKQNHPEATYQVAQAYEFGRGTKKDCAHAVQFYRKSAALGDAYGMHRLALILQHGLLGQAKNPKEAVTWLKRAAFASTDQYPNPIHDLALCYFQHGGSLAVIPDDAYAFELLSQAAHLGYPPSQYLLGNCYEKGKLGCGIDHGLSINWYRQAADQGNPEAEYSLSRWYRIGCDGVISRDESIACEWARKSAEQKFHKAQYVVGCFFEHGIGVSIDLAEAKVWYARSAAQGNKHAINRLKDLKKLTKSKKQDSNNRETSSQCLIM